MTNNAKFIIVHSDWTIIPRFRTVQIIIVHYLNTIKCTKFDCNSVGLAIQWRFIMFLFTHWHIHHPSWLLRVWKRFKRLGELLNLLGHFTHLDKLTQFAIFSLIVSHKIEYQPRHIWNYVSRTLNMGLALYEGSHHKATKKTIHWFGLCNPSAMRESSVIDNDR